MAAQGSGSAEDADAGLLDQLGACARDVALCALDERPARTDHARGVGDEETAPESDAAGCAPRAEVPSPPPPSDVLRMVRDVLRDKCVLCGHGDRCTHPSCQSAEDVDELRRAAAACASASTLLRTTLGDFAATWATRPLHAMCSVARVHRRAIFSVLHVRNPSFNTRASELGIALEMQRQSRLQPLSLSRVDLRAMTNIGTREATATVPTSALLAMLRFADTNYMSVAELAHIFQSVRPAERRAA